MANSHYWSTRYWRPQHWHADYWRDAALPGRFPYWSVDYWRSTWWEPNWWSTGVGGDNRIGALFGTTNITAALVGTFGQSIARSGTLSTTTQTLATFAGTVYQVQYVDWTINVGPSWSFYDVPAFNGELDATLMPFTGTSIGFTVPPDSDIGFINTTLAAFTSTLIGAFVAAPARTGAVVVTLADYGAAFSGTFVGILTNEGAITATLEDAIGTFAGSQNIPNRTGNFASTLEDVYVEWFGSATPPGAILGRLVVTIPLGTMAAYGTFTRSENIHDADLILQPLRTGLELLPVRATLEWTLRE